MNRPVAHTLQLQPKVLQMLSSHGIIKKLKEAGWKRLRLEGSHVILGHPDKKERITMPLAAGRYILRSRVHKAWILLKRANGKFSQAIPYGFDRQSMGGDTPIADQFACIQMAKTGAD